MPPEKEAVNGSRIRVLFVSHSSALGGAEKCLLMLLERLDRNRFLPVVALPGPGDLQEALTSIGIANHQVPLRWWVGVRVDGMRRRLAYLRRLKDRINRLSELIEREAIDVVFTNSLVILEGALAARVTGRPHVWHVLEILSQDVDLRPLVPLNHLYDVLDLLTDKVVAVSRGVAAELEPFLERGKVSVIHTGIACMVEGAHNRPKSDVFDLSEATPVVCYVGLLSKRKGVLTLVDAARLVLDQLPGVRFVLAGPEGGVGSQVRRRLAAYGIGGAVRLMGFRKDALDIIGSSDMLVLPSSVDPLPVVVLEAMHLGKPVVATRSGGCTEMVEDGQTGFLVPVDDPQTMAQAMLKLLHDGTVAQEMGHKSRIKAQAEFDVVGYVQRFEDLLVTTMGQKPGPTAERLRRAVAAGTAMLGDIGGTSLAAAAGSCVVNGTDWVRRGYVGHAYRYMRTFFLRLAGSTTRN